MDETVGFQETGISLPIKVGRVNLAATLQETIQQYNAFTRVGFFCGGTQLRMHSGPQRACLPLQLAQFSDLHKCQMLVTQHALRTHLQVAKGLQAKHTRLTDIL